MAESGLTKSVHSFDFALVLVLATLWAASYTFIKVGVESIPPITLMAARTAIAGVILLSFASIAGVSLPQGRTIWMRIFLQAWLSCIAPFSLLAWAMRVVDVSVAVILNSTVPLFAFVLTVALTRHEAVTVPKLFGVVIGFAGVVLVIGVNPMAQLGHDVIPQMAIVAATICYAFAAILGRTYQGLHPLIVATCMLLCSAVVLLPISVIVDHPWTLSFSSRSIGALIALSVFSTALAYVIYFRLIQRIGSIGTTAQAYLRMPIGVAFGVMFLGEHLTINVAVGLMCVLFGAASMARTAPT